MADALEPLARHAADIAVVKHRHDLLSERLVKVRTVHAVLLGDVVRVQILADGEAVLAVVAFAPPAVEDAHVHAAVAARLHAAGAAGLERAARVVQPDVAAGNHLARDVDVVVLKEDQMRFNLMYCFLAPFDRSAFQSSVTFFTWLISV